MTAFLTPPLLFAQVLAVHPGGSEDPTPFFTIALAGGAERDTVRARLRLARAPASEPAAELSATAADASATAAAPTAAPTAEAIAASTARSASEEEEAARREAVERSRREARQLRAERRSQAAAAGTHPHAHPRPWASSTTLCTSPALNLTPHLTPRTAAHAANQPRHGSDGQTRGGQTRPWGSTGYGGVPPHYAWQQHEQRSPFDEVGERFGEAMRGAGEAFANAQVQMTNATVTHPLPTLIEPRPTHGPELDDWTHRLKSSLMCHPELARAGDAIGDAQAHGRDAAEHFDRRLADPEP